MFIMSKLLLVVSFVRAFYLIWELDPMLDSTRRKADNRLG